MNRLFPLRRWFNGGVLTGICFEHFIENVDCTHFVIPWDRESILSGQF